MRVSGFALDELIGQPHNLIRHPDMPAEAFRDMWATLKAGVPWTALVKNRCKNGDHYWVRANVTPVMEDGRITGYMSVRTTPGRQEVAAAETLYAQMREEAASGQLRHRLHHGHVVRTGLAGRLRTLLNPGLGTQLVLLALASTAAAALLTLWLSRWGPLPAMTGALVLGAALATWTRRQALAPPGPGDGRRARDVGRRPVAGHGRQPPG